MKSTNETTDEALDKVVSFIVRIIWHFLFSTTDFGHIFKKAYQTDMYFQVKYCLKKLQQSGIPKCKF
uniref:Uncharacterized protein n=1 Tax=Acrobeloides nanus TaxID=290746 RepID=A0A914EAG5_9BILA